MFWFACCFSLLSLGPAYAWGPTGHRVVGELAERHLSPGASRELRDLMGPEDLARASTWPDEIRSDPAWQAREPQATRRHYLNIGPDQTLAQAAAASPVSILQAIPHFQAILADKQADPQERRIAIRWLVHLVGDAHQPLHAGYASDKGGNDVRVLWFGQPTNLHAVWDEFLIDHVDLSYTELAAQLDSRLLVLGASRRTRLACHVRPPLAGATLDPPSEASSCVGPDQIRAWQSDPPEVWLTESRALLVPAYTTPDGHTLSAEEPEGPYPLSYDYAYLHRPTWERRLQQAGMRLAALLEAALRTS